jgi:hypothetical protein
MIRGEDPLSFQVVGNIDFGLAESNAFHLELDCTGKLKITE